MLEIPAKMDDALPIDEKLKREERVCPQCRNILTNPFSERCPRCLTFVPVNDPGCGECVHNSSCFYSSVKS